MTPVISGILRAIASSILEMDDTAVPYEQLEILNDFLSKHHFNLRAKDADRLLRELKKKHLVDSISVVSKGGEVVVSSEGNGDNTGGVASQLLSYVGSELTIPESILIKGNSGWFMLFPFNGKTYLVKAQASLSTIELKALAAELESLVLKGRKTGNGR
jgi:hypothetical protein